MRMAEIERAVRAGFSDKELRSRIVTEGPVALTDVLEEMEARRAARTLTGRVVELESELIVQRASNGWS